MNRSSENLVPDGSLPHPTHERTAVCVTHNHVFTRAAWIHILHFALSGSRFFLLNPLRLNVPISSTISVFCFLVTPILRFSLLPSYWQLIRVLSCTLYDNFQPLTIFTKSSIIQDTEKHWNK